MPQRRYTDCEIQMLINQDGLLPARPFRTRPDECRYYARYIEKMLWRYLKPRDWERLAEIIEDVKVEPKLKNATRHLIRRHARH